MRASQTFLPAAIIAGFVLAACGGAGSPGTPALSVSPSVAPSPTPPGATPPGATPTPVGTATPSPQPSAAGLSVPAGFAVAKIAPVGAARELAFLPNGDLLVGTSGTAIIIVPQADAPGAAGTPKTFYDFGSDAPVAGVAFGPDGNIYAGSQHGVWKIAYHTGDQSESPGSAVQIGSVRTSNARSDHVTTTIAVSSAGVYASVGSSSNNTWPEIDATHATIQQLPLGGGTMTQRAVQLRNGIGLTVDPVSGHLWVAGAGQDGLAYGHPYEYADDVDAHPGVANYGWPFCEENHVQYEPGMDCSQQDVPLIEFPAYATHIGIAFYSAQSGAPYAFGSAYRGGLFVTSHGSWHCCPSTLPVVAYVPMNGDTPMKPVNWNDPTAQWQKFLWSPADSTGSTSYVARFTGVAAGPQGSLFVADDQNGAIYRIRPQ